MSDDARYVDLSAPAEVPWLAGVLEEAGFEAWAVGGAVRDALSGSAPEDWDLTTSARPADVRRAFRRTVPIGIEHGTVGVIGRSGRMYEVTTYRRDVETFGRKARVVFADRLEEDLARRDFTINAVAWHPLTHEVRDPHGGMRDLEDRILRTVGDPELRFAEDRLRVLRALRFAGRFHLRIEEATERAVSASADKLGNLSAERVREELWKVLSLQREASATLRLYERSGVLVALYPELAACLVARGDDLDGTGWDFLMRAVDAVSPAHPRVRLAALLHLTAPIGGGDGTGEGGEGAMADPGHRAAAAAAAARTVLRRLRCSNADIDTVTHLIAQHASLPSADAPDPDIRRWVRRVGRDHLRAMFRLLLAICRAQPATGRFESEVLILWRRARTVARSPVPLAVSDLAISGDDLRAIGITPGPLYGVILQQLLERVTDEPALNEREALLTLARAEAEKL
ncbi:MAG: CCA tRNA nucleotidyltransferase [Gemmatimonadota bacterium]